MNLFKYILLVAALTATAFAQAATSVTIGANAKLTATADGTAPFTFVWKKDGVVIPSASVVVDPTGASSSVQLTNVQQAQAGVYTAVITNSAGSATATATLAIKLVPPTNPRMSILEQLIAWLKAHGYLKA